MAKSNEKSESSSQNQSAESQAAPAGSQRVEIDDSDVQACYANFCRVNGTPEELIIDFGLNAHPTPDTIHPLKITQCLVVNHYTAKSLLAVLRMSIERHEAAFGVLKTNVQKRVLPQAMRSAEPSG